MLTAGLEAFFSSMVPLEINERTNACKIRAPSHVEKEKEHE